MKVVVCEPDNVERAKLCRHLGSLGCSVAHFADPQIAFLFLLGRLHEVDGVVVNVGKSERGAWLVDRLRLLAEPLAVVTYSGAEGARQAEVLESLLFERTLAA